MQLFCQSCQAAFAATSHCPRCGQRLLAPQESFIHASRAQKPLPDPVPATFTRRLTTGLLVAVGLVLALREFYWAWSGDVLDTHAEPASFALRVLAVLAGGLIAGAGRGRGVSVGAVTGLAFAALTTLFDLFLGTPASTAEMILPIVYPVLGAVAGAVGAWLWPADVELPEPPRQSSHGSSLARLAADEAERRSVRRTAWPQIALAALIVLAAVLYSDPIRIGLQKYSAGWLSIGGPRQSVRVGLQIAAIATILAGFVAAAGTGAGLKHGFLAGILTMAGLLIVAANRPSGLFPAVEGYLKLIGIEPGSLLATPIALRTTVGLLALFCASGWIGGQLFPPLAPKHMRRPRLERQC